MSSQTLPSEGFVRPAQVAFALGVSRATLYNWINNGTIPKPQKDGRITRWPVATIREIIYCQGGSVALEVRQDNQPISAA